MKYIISENKLNNLIYDYVVDMFMNNEEGELNYNYNYDDMGNETDDAIEFYFGDYGDAAFRWYSEKYFLLDKECDECPIVEMRQDLKDKLDAMFSDKWEIQFKKLMKKEFDLPVKTIK